MVGLLVFTRLLGYTVARCQARYALVGNCGRVNLEPALVEMQGGGKVRAACLGPGSLFSLQKQKGPSGAHSLVKVKLLTIGTRL